MREPGRKVTVPLRLSRDLPWQERHKNLLASPGSAVARIRVGSRASIGTVRGQPLYLAKALVARAHGLTSGSSRT